MTITKKPQLKPDVPYFEMVHSTRTPPEEEILRDPGVLNKIENLMKFFKETGIKYDDFDIDPEEDPLKGLRRSDTYYKSKDKKAYPNIDYYMYIPGQHNTDKWLQTVREIYYKEKNGFDRVAAIKQVTNGWNSTETYDFLNWLKYYEGGTHLKYKFAQLWYENGAPGYFLHVKPDVKKEEPSIDGKDIDMARDAISDEISVSEKKHIIEKQRNKIIGRLDSAEKLLRTHDGQIFAGKELEILLESIYQLKKKIQMINKISISTKLYEDIIVREANILNKKGLIKSADLLFSLSQANNPPPNGLGKVNEPIVSLNPTSSAPPQQGSGSVGGLPSTGPGMAQTPPESAPNETVPVSKGISDFLENLDTSNIGVKNDEQSNEDTLEVEDTLNINEANTDLFVTEGQDISSPIVSPQTTVPTVKKIHDKPLEVKENSTLEIENNVSTQTRDFDNMIDSAFSNIKISDVVAKLEDLAKIFKTREIPRQLSIVDMMLDSLGLAAYFPSLSEATNKALESNNYIATRIDDILAKLHGSIETKEVDLRGEKTPQVNSPELNSLKQSLKTQEDKEKIRKKQRKEQADQELDMVNTPKESPKIDIEEDLNQPAQPLQETTTPIKPVPQTIR